MEFSGKTTETDSAGQINGSSANTWTVTYSNNQKVSVLSVSDVKVAASETATSTTNGLSSTTSAAPNSTTSASRPSPITGAYIGVGILSFSLLLVLGVVIWLFRHRRKAPASRAPTSQSCVPKDRIERWADSISTLHHSRPSTASQADSAFSSLWTQRDPQPYAASHQGSENAMELRLVR